MPERQQITASPADVARHIDRLMGLSFEDLAAEVGRDPKNSNVAIVRLVADMRLAALQRDSLAAARRSAFWSIVVAIGTAVLAVATIALVVVTGNLS